MDQELLSRVKNSNLHIVLLVFSILFFIESDAYAQSVLLPADVVIVSVNSTNDSFDFIPLVPLEVGTKLWFSNGKWDNESFEVHGNEVEVKVIESIEAGTNIHLNKVEDSRLIVNGHLDFSSEGDRVFVYQKDEGSTRVIYGIGWGSLDVWNPNSDVGSEIPISISKAEKTLLQLGLEKNYQYYLRNGASGTPAMLVSFVGEVANWKGKSSSSYSSFKTAFRILRPPVVLFNESISTVQEGEPLILNVAIYEHDGSRLTVDAAFNKAMSIADTSDINGFNKHTFNFTGLIGNAVYAIEVPSFDDEKFEGTENAFFELENLSKGEFGDFVSHVAVISDNEIPDVQISLISYSNTVSSDFIEIQNTERYAVDLVGWKLVSRSFSYEFTNKEYLEPYQKLRIYHPRKNGGQRISNEWLSRNTGTVELRNHTGERISSLKYQNIKKEDAVSLETELSTNDIQTQSLTSVELSSGKLANIELQNLKKEKKEGWYILDESNSKEDFLSTDKLYVWVESLASFVEKELYSLENREDHILFSYFSEEELNTLEIDSLFVENDSLSLAIEEMKSKLEFSISATDFNNNGKLDGVEGFNLIHNTTTTPIFVKDIIQTIEEHTFKNVLYPYFYLWNNDGNAWSSDEVLSKNDLIPPLSYFWVKADSVIDETAITFQINPISEFFEEEEDRPLMELGVSLELDAIKRIINLDFYEGDEELEKDILIPEFEQELRSLDTEWTLFGAKKEGNWNSKVNLNVTDDQKLVFPIGFSSTLSGTFTLKTSDWLNIPADWEILLEDLESGKEYKVDQSMDLKFDYRFTQKDNSIELGHISNEVLAEGIQPRFNLIIIPPNVQEAELDKPDEITLDQNYPNPFNPTTTISFYLPESIPVKLSVFNIVGQPVSVLTEGTLGPGDHEFEWNATGLPSGMYIYQLEVGNKILTQKMTLVK